MILNRPSADPGSTQDYLPRIQNHQPNRGDPPRTDFPEAFASPAEPAGGCASWTPPAPASPKGFSTRTFHLPARGRGTRLGLLQVSQNV